MYVSCLIKKMQNVEFQLNATSWKSQKLIPSKKNQSFTIAKSSSHKIADLQKETPAKI